MTFSQGQSWIGNYLGPRSYTIILWDHHMPYAFCILGLGLKSRLCWWRPYIIYMAWWEQVPFSVVERIIFPKTDGPQMLYHIAARKRRTDLSSDSPNSLFASTGVVWNGTEFSSQVDDKKDCIIDVVWHNKQNDVFYTWLSTIYPSMWVCFLPFYKIGCSMILRVTFFAPCDAPTPMQED